MDGKSKGFRTIVRISRGASEDQVSLQWPKEAIGKEMFPELHLTTTLVVRSFFACPSIQIVTSHLSPSTSCCLSRSQSPKHLQNHGVSSIFIGYTSTSNLLELGIAHFQPNPDWWFQNALIFLWVVGDLPGSLGSLGTKKKCQDKSICKGTSKKNAVKYIYIYTNNNNNNPENRPKRNFTSPLHINPTKKKHQLTEASQSRKVNLEQAGCRRSGPRRGHWRRGAGEVPQGGVGGFNDPKRLIQPIENGDLTHWKWWFHIRKSWFQLLKLMISSNWVDWFASTGLKKYGIHQELDDLSKWYPNFWSISPSWDHTFRTVLRRKPNPAVADMACLYIPSVDSLLVTSLPSTPSSVVTCCTSMPSFLHVLLISWVI